MKKGSKAHYNEHRERARAMIEQKVRQWNSHPSYGFAIGRISIRNQVSRWGSCSKQGNLNFNYKLALLPEHIADYVIVHEICHRGEFNHSRAFWNLVAQAVPDHKERRAELRRIEKAEAQANHTARIERLQRRGYKIIRTAGQKTFLTKILSFLPR